MATILTDECQAGQKDPAARNPFLFSSDSWLAYLAGQRIAGMSTVRSCRKARGYSVVILTAGGNTVRVTAKGAGLEDINVVREG